jgi:peptidoglycan/xylan/chitin deacetylase (PgdA/CDA1 family)
MRAKNSPCILLTFDVEEFDIPLEYQCNIDMAQQMEIGQLGLQAIMHILNNKELTCTLFTTANFAQQYPADIKRLAAQHEIASHTFYHSSFKNEDLAASKIALENICGKPVTGLRMPRMRAVEMEAVKAAGYQYDSSINPTWLPGRYNYTHLPRTPYMEKEVLRLPASVSPNLRIPLFWLAFKNFPYQLFRMLALQTLKKDGYLNLYFHPWEFTDINGYNLPGYVKRACGKKLIAKLERLIYDLQKEGDFISIAQYLEG